MGIRFEIQDLAVFNLILTCFCISVCYVTQLRMELISKGKINR